MQHAQLACSVAAFDRLSGDLHIVTHMLEENRFLLMIFA
jgi:hypothetical protein